MFEEGYSYAGKGESFMGLFFSKKECPWSLIALLWAQVRIRVPEKYIRRGSFQEWGEGYRKVDERVRQA